MLEFSSDKLHVRLIGRSSAVTNKELADYYFGKFHYWKGNLRKEPHLVKPLFIDALKADEFIQKVKTEVK